MKPRLVLLGVRAGVLALGLVVASGAVIRLGEPGAAAQIAEETQLQDR